MHILKHKHVHSIKEDKYAYLPTRRTCWTEADGIVRKQPHREETPGKNTVEKQSGNNLERLRDRERSN